MQKAKFKLLVKEDSSSSASYELLGCVLFLRIKERQANKSYHNENGLNSCEQINFKVFQI